MEMLQTILYSIFGIITLFGLSNTFIEIIYFIEYLIKDHKTEYNINNTPLIIGLIGLLLTYLWL